MGGKRGKEEGGAMAAGGQGGLVCVRSFSRW